VTKKERADVVMLLRCAADVAACSGPGGAMARADFDLGTDHDTFAAAGDAERYVCAYVNSDWWDEGRHIRLLEAALLVEEGALP
jgi:hypothetical protein